MNPVALKTAIEKTCEVAGVPCPVVACVSGDDILDRIHDLKDNNKLRKVLHPCSKDVCLGVWCVYVMCACGVCRSRHGCGSLGVVVW